MKTSAVGLVNNKFSTVESDYCSFSFSFAQRVRAALGRSSLVGFEVRAFPPCDFSMALGETLCLARR